VLSSLVMAGEGDLIWSYQTWADIYSSPAVAYGRVYVGGQDNCVHCLDAETGSLLWSYTTGGRVDSSPAVAYGKVFVGSNDHNIYCLDAGEAEGWPMFKHDMKHTGYTGTPISDIIFLAELAEGWNLVGYGGEYLPDYPLTDVLVSYYGVVKTWAEAVSAGWVMGYMFYFVPGIGYRKAGLGADADDAYIRNGQGYWVLAFQPLVIIFPK